MRFHSRLLAIAVVATALNSQRAESSTIIFNDRAAFDAAVQPNELVTFDKVVSVDDPSVPASCVNGLCQALVDDILLTSADDLIGLPHDGELPVYVLPTALTLEGGARFGAIGFDISSDVTFHLLVSWDGVSEPQIPFTFEGERFVGLSFSAPVRSVSLIFLPLRGFSPGIVDNMSIRTAPEPSTLLLAGSALVLLQGGRKFAARRRRPTH